MRYRFPYIGADLSYRLKLLGGPIKLRPRCLIARCTDRKINKKINKKITYFYLAEIMQIDFGV